MMTPFLDDPLADVMGPLESARRGVATILHAARSHLGMDVAFISEFQEKVRVFRHVDAVAGHSPLQPGDISPLAAGYCRRVIEGLLPELIADTSKVPAAMALPETHAIPIGSHLSVPIRLASGRVYGTFCCFSFRPDASLNERDLGMMRTLANLVAQQLDEELESERNREDAAARVRRALDQGQPRMVYQPIFRIEDGGVEGVECLARFELEPCRPPNEWFDEAAAVGMGVLLESAAYRCALRELQSLAGDFVIAINCSPRAIVDGQLPAALHGVNAQRIVLEITEHSSVENYAQLRQALVPLRAAGVRIAIDDTGAGYASMRHILAIDPDIIKLDISLTRNIHRDRRRRALAGAMLEFARHTGSTIVAEGVESADELDTLRELGVKEVQGYYLSSPLPLARLGELLARKYAPSRPAGRSM